MHIDPEWIQQIGYGVGLILSSAAAGLGGGWAHNRRAMALLAKEDPSTPRTLVERVAVLEEQNRHLMAEVSQLREWKHKLNNTVFPHLLGSTAPKD